VLQLEQATGAFRILYCSFASNFSTFVLSQVNLNRDERVTARLLEFDVNIIKAHLFPVRLACQRCEIDSLCYAECGDNMSCGNSAPSLVHLPLCIYPSKETVQPTVLHDKQGRPVRCILEIKVSLQKQASEWPTQMLPHAVTSCCTLWPDAMQARLKLYMKHAKC